MHDAAPPPAVSIVIPAYNEESVIRQCLIAAVYQSVPAHEIIVVDNLSKDRTAEIVRQMQLEYPESPIILLSQDRDQGLIPTRNFGLDHATGDILGRIDADSVLEPDWVEQVQKAFADESVHAATGPVVYYDMPMRRFGLKADDKMRQLMLKLAKHQYHFLFGSNMAMRRSAWETIRTRSLPRRAGRDARGHRSVPASGRPRAPDPVLAADDLGHVRPAAGGLAPGLPLLRDAL